MNVDMLRSDAKDEERGGENRFSLGQNSACLGGKLMDASTDAPSADASCRSSPSQQGGRQCEGIGHDFGAKDIGFFAGCALLVNNITGPGVPQLPNVFVEAGWLFPVLCILVIWVMTTFSSAMFCEAMRKIPGNEHFRGRVEYTTVVKYYFGRRWYVASQVGLNGALQALNIVSIIQSAQVLDNAISVVFGRSCAINLSPFSNVWTDQDGRGHPVEGSTNFISCINTNDLGGGNAWGCHIVLTVGFVITAALAIPCGRWNLDDNMYIQVVAVIMTIGCWLIWMFASFQSFDADSAARIPAINSDPTTGSQAGVLGAILFNFGFVTTVPSWVNEKRHQVSTSRTLWISTFICILVFLAVGIPGGVAFSDVLQGSVSNTCARQARDPSFNCPNNLLQVITDGRFVSKMWMGVPALAFTLNLSVYIFPIVAIISSIPVFSIVIKYNMMENGFSNGIGFLWGVIFPWVVAFPLIYMPNVLGQFVNFTSLVFVSFTDFIVPWAIYIKLQRRRQAELGVEANSILNEEEVAMGIRAHYSMPRSWGIGPGVKSACALALSIILACAAALATVLTIQEGDYTLNQQVCALVGS